MMTYFRWSPQRKAGVLREIDDGTLAEADAIKKYGLSIEELYEWRQKHAAQGLAGLYVTPTKIRKAAAARRNAAR